MKLWTNATHEDVVQELAPGVSSTNEDAINKLNWTSWLLHMGELIDMNDSNRYELTTREHFDTLLLVMHDEYMRAVYGVNPTAEEANKYMNLPSTQETLNHLTTVTVNLTRENWPEFRDGICQEVGLDPKDFHFSFEMD